MRKRIILKRLNSFIININMSAFHRIINVKSIPSRYDLHFVTQY